MRLSRLARRNRWLASSAVVARREAAAAADARRPASLPDATEWSADNTDAHERAGWRPESLENPPMES